VLFCLSAAPAAGASDRSAAARGHALRGAYDKAIAIYDELLKEDAHAPAAACGRARVDRWRGDYAAGIERLKRIARRGASSAEWHVCLAELLIEIGAYAEAESHLRSASRLEPEDLHVRRVLGGLLEMLGRADEAKRVYALFEEIATEGPLPDRAEDLTDLGIGFYRITILQRPGNRKLVRRTRHVLTEIYQEAFDFVDPEYWPARLAAAELLLAKHNLADAALEFEAILERNPACAAAHVGLGSIALERWDFEQAEERVESAVEANPRHVGAQVLLAETRMTERRYGDAAEAARGALQTNPNSIYALSVLAAAQLRMGERDASQATQARVKAINPKPAVLHFTLGRWLAAARQYEDAERELKQAIEFAPSWVEPRTELGLLYMDSGHEDQARMALEASHAMDSFNLRTFSYLSLLDQLDHYAATDTEHFIIKHAQDDAVIGRYFAFELEAMHDGVCSAFGHRPARRTTIEVFANHDDFSTRISGRPFIATVGACTGPVIAMSAPNGRSPFGRYNWSHTLRHEFVHTVTLAATGNRIPHWMTEGLAVLEEPAPRSWEWKRLLSDAVHGDRLFTLKSIDWGFMRPRRAHDRSLAYAQSEWMIEYIIERQGEAVVRRFLEAFDEGLDQAAAFRRVLEIETEAFDRDFQEWARRQAAKWSLPARAADDVEALEKQVDGSPEDVVLIARLSLAYLKKGEFTQAEASARKALAMKADHPRALEAMARVIIVKMLREKDEDTRRELIDEANPYLRRLIAREPDHAEAIKYLGYVEQAWSQWREAIDYYGRYLARFPEDPDPRRRLAAIYGRLNNHDAELRELERLAAYVEDDPMLCRQVADAYARRDAPARVAEWLERAIRIDPYDAETHRLMGEAYLAMDRLARAEREFEVLSALQPDDGAGLAGLSRVYRAMGDLERAERYRQRAAALGARPPADRPGS